MQPRRRSKSVWLSPLRFPGSKRRLAAYVRRTLDTLDHRPSVFIEPFAGGASVALQLLGEGTVEQIGLADKDPLIAAFWKTVFFDSEWLVEQVQTIDVTLERWRDFKLRAYWPNLSRRERAVICLFLNRTSFSGIVGPTAGPLGGWDQASEYPLDCRFPRDTLERRIARLAMLADRVAFVWNTSWPRTHSLVQDMRARGSIPENIFFYLDPPFFEKADRLYGHFFVNGDHERLRDALSELDAPWILSYDAHDRVVELYPPDEFTLASVDLLYNTPGNGNHATSSEAIVSNLPTLPSDVELWRRGKRRAVVARTDQTGKQEVRSADPQRG